MTRLLTALRSHALGRTLLKVRRYSSPLPVCVPALRNRETGV